MSNAMPFPHRDPRAWYSIDWPSTLVAFTFLAVVMTILSLAWLRHQQAQIPEPGYAIPQYPEDETTQPPTRETLP
jgi:hypothetical protein